jgi:hypothetical protein
MPSERPLNVIWNRVTLDGVLEGHFIRDVLLGDIGRPVRFMIFEPRDRLPLLNDALVVSLNIEFAEYLKALRSHGCRNIGLLHMGDEGGDHDLGFYAHADYVFRHYWFEHALVRPNDRCLGVTWVPAGYRTGVGPILPNNVLEIAERSIMGFFAGALAARTFMAERQNMMDVVKAAKLPFYAVGTPGFAQGFGPVSYAALLGNSRFALVPAGNSPETIRLYDALEAGAIPIMLNSAVVQAPDGLDNPPFLLLNSWTELPAAYEPFSDSKSSCVLAALEEKRMDVSKWWSSFKVKQQRRVKEIISRSFGQS